MGRVEPAGGNPCLSAEDPPGYVVGRLRLRRRRLGRPLEREVILKTEHVVPVRGRFIGHCDLDLPTEMLTPAGQESPEGRRGRLL